MMLRFFRLALLSLVAAPSILAAQPAASIPPAPSVVESPAETATETPAVKANSPTPFTNTAPLPVPVEPVGNPTPVVACDSCSARYPLDDSCTQTACGPAAKKETCEDSFDWGQSAYSPFLKNLKNQSVWDELTISTGGGLRYRYMDERNRLGRPANVRGTYDLWRWNPWVTMKYSDLVSGRVEAIDASIFNNELATTPIDRNRMDLLQYYVDLHLMDDGEQKLTFRAGRQFLKYGSQHLISPLAWANTFRNFEGFKLFYDSPAWSIDGFVTRPVNGATGNIFRPESADHPDESRTFSGVYATWKNAPQGTLDLYWLWLKEDEALAGRADGNRHTIGLRYAGKQPMGTGVTSWDLEGAYQWGRDNLLAETGNVSAGFLSAIVTHTLKDVTWTPAITALFFWGSGDNNPADGDINTVSTLFPLGHAYWGQIDNLGGQNLLNYAVQGSVKPTKKFTFLAAWHWFDKADSSDVIYNVAGAPQGPNNAATNIGNELDLIATYQANENLQIQAGYFWFFYGDAVTQTVLTRPDAQQFYLMTTLTY